VCAQVHRCERARVRGRVCACATLRQPAKAGTRRRRYSRGGGRTWNTNPPTFVSTTRVPKAAPSSRAKKSTDSDMVSPACSVCRQGYRRQATPARPRTHRHKHTQTSHHSKFVNPHRLFTASTLQSCTVRRRIDGREGRMAPTAPNPLIAPDFAEIAGARCLPGARNKGVLQKHREGRPAYERRKAGKTGCLSSSGR
jgi:hypothetical protein